MSVRLRYLLAFCVLFLILLIPGNVSVNQGVEEAYGDARDSLVVYIGFPSGYNTGKGHPHGFHHQLLSDCSVEIGKHFVIPYNKLISQTVESLLQGRADIVALDMRDSSYLKYQDKIRLTSSFHNYAWAVRENDLELLWQLNHFLGRQEDAGNMKRLYNRYFSSYSLKPYLATNTKRSSISPYDNLIKRYSRQLGWDWRLLSAVIKKESRFCIGARSSRGAMGLMQVLPSTAQVYGVNDCYSPSENIKAGTAFLSEIKSNYESMGLDSANVVKFTLAAYNAGQSRIRDCILFAREQGVDASDWDSVAGVIPLMAVPEYYEQADYLRHGAFSGKETLTYVRDILATYGEYLQAVE